MKTKLEIIKEKFEKHFPLSMQISNDAIQFSIDNNIGWSKAFIFENEMAHDLTDKITQADEFQAYLSSLGYYAVTNSSHSHMMNKDKQFHLGWSFLIFFTQSAFEKWKGACKKAEENYKFYSKVPSGMRDAPLQEYKHFTPYKK